jgi:drug/metabolite transporter (DMT)-like permease
VEYVLGVVAAALLGTSFVLQQGAAQQVPASDLLRLRMVADLLRKPRWLAGIGAMVCGQVLSAWVIGHIILAVSEPLLATNLLVALSLAWPLSGQRLKPSEILGAAILLAGIVALAVAQSVSSAHDTIGSPRYWPYCGAAIAILGGCFAAGVRRCYGRVRALFAGAGAGLAFGVQDALTRRTVDALGGLHQLAALLTSWPAYCLVIASVAGLWLMQNAFSSAPLHVSLPAITAGEPVCGMVLGIIVFREKVPVSPGMIALQAAGAVALVVGVVMAARAPALGPVHPARHNALTARDGCGRDDRGRRDSGDGSA